MTILDIEYWPSLSWMHRLYTSNEILLQTGGNYQKQSLFNRCHIISKDGPLTLSVPLVGGREQKVRIQEVRIDHSQRWAIRQIRTLKSCYGKAPFFDYYFPVIESLLQQPHENMLSLNQKILEQLIKWLNWKGKVQHAQSFIPVTDKAEMKLEVQPYLQVFTDNVAFVPNLSVLDGLFCMGPHLKHYLVDSVAFVHK